MKRETKKKIIKAILTILLATISIIMIMPFAWMISSSLKAENQIFNFPIEWIPRQPILDNYNKVFNSGIPFGKFLVNSIKVSTLSVLGEVATSALAGYAFSKIKFQGRNLIFLIYLATLAFPLQLMLLPRFVIFRMVKLYNTHLALILPGMFTAFGTFMLKQFFDTIPDELCDAAKIDGASHFQNFTRIIMPLSKAGLSALIILQFVGAWNDYESPLIFLRSRDLATIPLGLNYFKAENSTSYGAIMAASCISLIPIFIVFLTFQKQFVAGIATSGLKE